VRPASVDPATKSVRPETPIEPETVPDKLVVGKLEKNDPTADPPVGKKKVDAKSHEAPTAPEPPEFTALLEQAERALSSGNTKEARWIADRALRVQKGVRAFSLQTRAYCLDGDLGGARGTFPHVTGGERARVLKYCSAHNTPLD
jgi:hypothetical protein